MNAHTVTVVVPACNEGPSLNHFLPKLREVGATMSERVRILVVDDGSTDDTTDVVKHHRCKTLRNDENMGIGQSIRKGIAYALEMDSTFVITMDSDGQHSPKILPRILKELENGVEVVTASRYHHESERISPPIDRDLLNIAFVAAIRSVTGWAHITDPLTGFWGMNQRVAKFFTRHTRQERYGIWLEALVKLWYLCRPKPHFIQIPHPAIYDNTNGGFLNRVYSPANMEQRVERFGTHALHILQALHDVHADGHQEEIEARIKEWRAPREPK